jgi:tryptophan halogenase
MKIVIVGGGTAGWLAAYCLCKAQPGQHDITVIESSSIGIIGVGEATTGLTKDLLNGVLFPAAVDIKDFINKTDATNKMGIYHKGWAKNKESYFAPLDASSTFQLNNDFVFKYAFQKFGYDKFHMASRAGVNWENQNFDEFHAYQFDTHKVGQFFKEICLKENIKIIDSVVTQVNLNESGGIDSVILEQGYSVSGDFFFDCTGFKRVLMEAVGSKWISYKKYLPVDTAMPFRLTYQSNERPLPMTTAHAMSSGWMWDIPLQSRRGCGYVFDSNFISKETAQKEIESYLGMEIEPIKFIDLSSGKSDTFWKNNVLSLGLSSSFVEPLESTSIHNTIVQIMVFIDEFLSPVAEKTVTKENEKLYNKNIDTLFEYVFDFLSLHYQGGRDDSEFWRNIKNNKIVTDYTQMLINKSKDKIIGATTFDNANPNAPGAALWNWVMAGLHIITPEQARQELIETGMMSIAEHHWNDFHTNLLHQKNRSHAWSTKPYVEYTK